MAFRRTTLKGKGGRLLCPIAAPVEHVVIWKVMPGWLSLDRLGFEISVVPKQRPEVFGTNLTELLQPFSHTLGLATMKALSQAIEQVVVRIEMALRMSAWIFLTFACTRQRTFKDVTKIKHVIAAGQHRVRNVLMHQTKARAMVKVFACGVCMRVEMMKQPWR